VRWLLISCQSKLAGEVIVHGVRRFISLVEILTIKSVGGFADAGCTRAESLRYAIFVFFGGALICHGFDVVISFVMRFRPEVSNDEIAPSDLVDLPPELQVTLPDPRDLEADSRVVSEEEARIKNLLIDEDLQKAQELLRMGVISAIVVMVHNIPEGIATFVSSLADTSTGLSVALAVALHNIPEGLIIAVPIYFATGSRLKAFFWTFISGVAEPFGALLAFFALKGSDMSPMAYAVLFGVVSGIMTYIALSELLPNALQYDPEGKVWKKSLFGGMAVIAASILLFESGF